MRDKVFKIVSDLKYDGYQRRLASMVYNFFDKSLVEVVLTFHSQINLLLKQIINMKMSFIGRLFLNLIDEKSIRHLETIFGVLNQLICNH